MDSEHLQRFLKTAKELSLCGIDKVLTGKLVSEEEIPDESKIEVQKDRYVYKVFTKCLILLICLIILDIKYICGMK